MRILVCTNVYPPRFVGGAELVAHEVARQMLAQGHEVAAFVGALDGPGGHHAMWHESRDGIDVYRINTVQRDYDPQHLNFWHPQVDRHFAEVLESFKPEVVHCHNLMGLSARLPILAREAGARVFVTLHDFWGFCLRNTLRRDDGSECDDYSACRLCLPRNPDTEAGMMPLRWRKDLLGLVFDHVEGFIAPSAYLAGRYLRAGFSPQRMKVLPNGMDLQRFAPSLPKPSTGRLHLLYVGYFGPHKGVDILLQAMGRCRGQDLYLELVGEGSEEDAYRARIAELGLEDRVIWRGRVQPANMPEVYAGADAVVLPSVWGENQPVCLMEAMACGLPVIASRIGGIPEIFEHGQQGLLFHPGDPDALADALRMLAASPERRQAMGRSGRDRVLQSSYRNQAASLLQLFAEGQQDEGERRQAPLVAVLGDDPRKIQSIDHVRMEEKASLRWRVLPLSWMTASMKRRVEQVYLLDNGSWRVKFFRFIMGSPYKERVPPAASWWKRKFFKFLLHEYGGHLDPDHGMPDLQESSHA